MCARVCVTQQCVCAGVRRAGLRCKTKATWAPHVCVCVSGGWVGGYDGQWPFALNY
jgi:hypothetical protein